MTGLLAALLVQAIGVALSPLAIIAVLAVLGTTRARRNGVAFLAGWTLGLLLVLGGGFLLANALGGDRQFDPPSWLAPVHLVLGVLLVGAAVFIYRRGRAKLLAAAHAATTRQTLKEAPQLPSWLASVQSFRPGRCLLLGVAAFLLNPVDVSCTLAAALDLSTTPVGTTRTWIAAAVFVVVGLSSVAGPVVWYLLFPARASHSLGRMQLWIAEHTTLLNAALALAVGLMQLSKGFQGL